MWINDEYSGNLINVNAYREIASVGKSVRFYGTPGNDRVIMCDSMKWRL